MLTLTNVVRAALLLVDATVVGLVAVGAVRWHRRRLAVVRRAISEPGSNVRPIAAHRSVRVLARASRER